MENTSGQTRDYINYRGSLTCARAGAHSFQCVSRLADVGSMLGWAIPKMNSTLDTAFKMKIGLMTYFTMLVMERLKPLYSSASDVRSHKHEIEPTGSPSRDAWSDDTVPFTKALALRFVRIKNAIRKFA